MKSNLSTKYQLAGICLLLVAITGCSGSEEISKRPKVFPVSGKISFEGKQLEDAVVKLFPVNQKADIGTKLRPKARLKKDGTFSIGTFKAGDGAPAGNYVLTVSWKGSLEDFDDDEDSFQDLKELMPWEYTVPGQSKIRVSVKDVEENVIPEIIIES